MKGEEEFDNQYSDVAQYGKVQFWDDRYAGEAEPFEWYYGYEFFRDTINEYIPQNRRVLVAGCGNSNMLEDMAKDGYTELVGADLSRVVINQMKIKCEYLPEISFFQVNLVVDGFSSGIL